MLAGVQVREDRAIEAGRRVIVAVLTAPLYEARTSAVVWIATAVTAAVNIAVLAPDATVTAAGTVKFVLLLVSETPIPEDTAGDVSEIVQAMEPAPVIEVGAHDKALNWGAGG